MLTTGILEVLYCVLIESPEVLNIIQENHIKSIISLLDKHGRNHKVSEYYLSLYLSREVFKGNLVGSPVIWESLAL